MGIPAIHGLEAKLIDDEDRCPHVLAPGHPLPFIQTVPAHPCDKLVCGKVGNREAVLDRLYPQCRRKVGLAHSRRAEKKDVLTHSGILAGGEHLDLPLVCQRRFNFPQLCRLNFPHFTEGGGLDAG